MKRFQKFGIRQQSAEISSDRIFDSSFIKTFSHLTNINPSGRILSLFLTANWESPMMSVLFEGLDFHCLSLQINQSIEVCYRNVNLDKLKKNVQFFQKNVLEAGV